MKKFASSLSNDLVLECKGAILNKDMGMSRLKMFMQQVEEEKKRQEKLQERERQTKRVKIADQNFSQ